MKDVRAGDTVRCIDICAKPEWAEWYMDNAYASDMLVQGKLYLVRAVGERDGMTGYDVGVPTPWSDRYWAAERFERSLLRLSSTALTTRLQEG